MVVADDGALEQRKRVLYRLRRYPDPLRQFLAMISWRVFLAGKQTLVDGIAICDNLFGVHGEFGIRHRLDGFESAVRHRLQMNPSVALGQSGHHSFWALRKAELRDGHYLLRSNMVAEDPAVLWERYIQLTQIETAFRTMKSEPGIRPIYHQLEHRVEAHILVAFLASCLTVTLKNRLHALAPGLTPKAVLEKLGAIQMLDVCLPTTDGRWLVMPRYTQPEAEQAILLHKLQLRLPQQPPPLIKLQHPSQSTEALQSVVPTL